MKKILLCLLIGSFCLVLKPLLAADDILAVNTNFGPARPAGTTSEPAAQSTPTPQPAPVVSQPVPTANSNLETSSRTLAEETVRRQESQLVAQQIITEGIKLYYEAKYTEAIAKLDKALKLLPRAPATEIDYNRAARAMGDSYYRLADAAYRAQDTSKAVDLAKKSLEYSPDNRGSENIIAKVRLSEQKVASAAAAKASSEARAEQPEPIRPPHLDETPEFKAKQREIVKLFREGRILANSGQYDAAEQRYNQVLLIDHYNEDAYRDLQELNDDRRLMSEEGIDASRRRRLWEVNEAWLPKLTSQVRPPQETEKPADINVSSVAKQKIEAKLKKIVFPDVSFREAAISDVVTFLSTESRKYDDDKEGINIVLGGGLQSTAAPTPPTAPATPDGGVPAPLPAPTPTGGIRPITLSLRNVPMSEVLKYVTSLGGLKMRIESSAIIILPADAVGDSELVTRNYKVSPDAIKSMLASVTGAAPVAPPATGPGGMAPMLTSTTPAGGEASSAELKQAFVDSGVPFPTGSSLRYNERARIIFVRNTWENLETFEAVLSSLNLVPTQVEIEAKFIEINQTDLDELGFQWAANGINPVTGNSQGLNFGTLGSLGNNIFGPMLAGTGGSSSANGTNSTISSTALTGGLRGVAAVQGNQINQFLVGQSSGTVIPDAIGSMQIGIAGGPEIAFVINALAQKQSADTLNAPKVTTISGAQAQVRVVQEFIYPTEYSQPTVAEGSAPTPSIPSGWKTREVGVILNVTPTVNADGYTINLTLVPEVSEFKGMLDYSPGNMQGFISVPGSTNVFPISIPFKIWQPLFETRNVTTSVVIWDGQTVVLGGLLTDAVSKIDDKVPFLGDIPFIGRLFRSKVNSRVKRNLLIFVTARLIDPAGNPIHKAEASSFTPPPR